MFQVAMQGLRYELRGALMVVSWRLHNRGDVAAYVTDRVARVEVGGQVAVVRAPTVRVGGAGDVVLRCALAPLRAGARPIAPPVAYGRRLDAGQEEALRLELPLPLRDSASGDAPDARTRVFAALSLEVGVVPDDPSLHATERALDGAPLWRLTAAAWRLQQTVRASVAGAGFRLLCDG